MFKICDDEKYGYKKLVDFDKSEVKSLYENTYWTQKFFEGKVKDRTGSENKYREITDGEWITETFYVDVLDFIEKYKQDKCKILDIGCGGGWFLDYFKKKGHLVYGVEPALNLKPALKEKGIKVFTGSIYDVDLKEKFDVITLNNVLEHIENPDLVIEKAYELLDDEGILIVKVPNDFNLIQEEANRFVEKKDWWVCYPDHLNYFNSNSLVKLVEDKKFTVEDKMSDFPLDMFLLMGMNYVDDVKVGSEVHNMRKQFEVNIEKEKRRNLFRGFTKSGIGRNIIVFARKGGK
ncbi:MAG: class I SAM-dependent methyltransferase [Sarcina sp.]